MRTRNIIADDKMENTDNTKGANEKIVGTNEIADTDEKIVDIDETVNTDEKIVSTDETVLPFIISDINKIIESEISYYPQNL